MMKARLGTLLLVTSLAVPGAAFAQDRGTEHEAVVERASEPAPSPGARVRDDGAIPVDALDLAPRAPQPRFGEQTIAPALQSEYSTRDELAMLRPASRGQASALMIAGAALFVAGLIIEDDAGTVVAVAGAAIGAYGLYLYLE